MAFQIGDKVFMGSYTRVERRVECPDCCGNRFLTVIMGNGDHVRIDCAGCQVGWGAPSGKILQWDFEVEVTERVVTGIRVSREKTEYELDGSGGHCYIGREGHVFATKEEAIAAAEAEKQAHADAENKRLMAKTKGHRSWAWNAHYHLNCAKEAKRQLEYHQNKASICNAKASSPQPSPLAPRSDEQ